MDEERTIDYYDRLTGWGRVPDPFTSEEGGEYEIHQAAGFYFFTKIGADSYCGVQIWSGPDHQYLVFVEGFDAGHDILVADFPSVLELMEKLAPMITASELTCLRETASELKALLTNRNGPLAEAQNLHRQIEEREYAIERKHREAREAKAKAQGGNQ